MTAQFEEILYCNGEAVGIFGEPLKPWLEERKIDRSLFKAESSACWRGYRGTWELRDKRLYLTNLKGNLGYDEDSGQKNYASVSYLFPNQNEVFAEWFSGVIRIPKGELLEYVHFPYASIFEKEVELSFEKGILVKKKTKRNIIRYLWRKFPFLK